MIKKAIFIMLLSAYIALIIPFSTYLKSRPVVVKLGYMPDAEVLKLAVGDHRPFIAQYAVVKVLFYFGTLVEKFRHKIILPPEYFNMFKTLQIAIKMDPYNSDAYYFVQASFTWEIGRIKEVNDLLVYGMKYRTWDYNLPFYVAFNYAYFLKDYKSAASSMRKAAVLSGIPMFGTLAARYFYEAGQNELGIHFLEAMRKGARDAKVRSLYDMRIKALLEVQEINKAIERFQRTKKKRPANISELTDTGFLGKIPEDPYGGTFYIDRDGAVRSTSKFAFGGGNK